MKDTVTRTQIAAVLGVAALVLALIVVVSPKATVIANEVSGDIYGIDFFGTNNEKNETGSHYAGF